MVRCTAGPTRWLGGSLRELDDVLAEVGLDGRDAVGLEPGVEADLLGDHALALGHRAGTGRAADVEDDGARLGRVARPVDRAAPLEDLRLERLQVEVEMGQRVVLDLLAEIAQRARTRAGGGARGRPACQPVLILPSAVCSCGSSERLRRALAKGEVVASMPQPVRRSPIAGAREIARQHLGDVAGLHAASPAA